MNRILVANRGEIACRVIKSIKKMGAKAIAVYSTADAHALHVQLADEAYCIGNPPSSDSYLRQDKILEICKLHSIDAVHPGYGFLSENSNFARLLDSNGITLIGPSAESMELMGDKLSSKEAVKEFGIPMVPGTDYAIKTVAEGIKIANKIGVPLLIKASAGGGGKGMKLVENIEDFEDQMELAVNEATAAFGNGAVFIEKFVSSPRHIEIQILADNYGNIVYLFERECSIQRRHQKVVEEAPSSILTDDLRRKMGEDAVKVAKAANYVGAGTVEFLVDDQLNYYFLEMNTRLQVEHPVTELITNLDLVEWQIRIARGEKLGFDQKDISIQGHAIELRVYAEDPYNNFAPSINKLTKYILPPDARVDNGFVQGDTIPIFYDPLLSKLIVYGANRAEAIQKMKLAIQSYIIEGIATTLDFGAFVMNHPNFVEGNFDTNFVKKFWNPNDHTQTNDLHHLAAWLAQASLNEFDKQIQFGAKI